MWRINPHSCVGDCSPANTAGAGRPATCACARCRQERRSRNGINGDICDFNNALTSGEPNLIWPVGLLYNQIMKLIPGNHNKSIRRSALSLTSLLPVVIMLTFVVVLAACSEETPTAVTPEPAPLAPGTPTPTIVPSRPLTICVGQEPSSLFPVDNPSPSARAILAAVYDGPIDTNSYGYQPIILKTLPSLANGDAQLFQKSVYVGDEVVDASNIPVTLATGMKIRPAGCRSDACAVTYDGKGTIQMDQMQVTFRLLPGLTWSDGLPLTSADSVFAYDLAADPSFSGNKFLIERTQSYEAADDVTIQWWGRPGFIDTTYLTDFWMPLPQHLWSKITASQLDSSPEASRSPIGWGAYVIDEWAAGDHITLTKNPRYFRAGEGLPKFTTLTFRFVSDPATAVSDLIGGTCDILDPSISLDGQVDLLRSMAGQNKLQVLFAQPPVMEQLAFGIRPVAYDNGYNAGVDRPDFFGDVNLRQAVAMCIDRQKLVDSVLQGLSTVPASYVPADYPLYTSSATTYSFDVKAANALLDKIGWRDVDNDPLTPRVAFGVKNVPDATRLELDYITTGATQRVQVSGMVADSLAQCGIQVNVKYLDQTALYAAGPDGPLFGRSFEMAEFAMGSTGEEPPCEWFTSSEIPSAANYWVGTNVSGYSSPAFDAACQAVQQSLTDETTHADAYHQDQMIFTQDLPVLPLYWRIKVAAARPGICHYSLDPTASSSLWNIEMLDSGISCSK
jgi:peptide/nickel transport system substrate-binding protein